MDPRTILKDTFGFDSFRPGQEELIRAVLRKRDVMGIMPTGAGKSVCFQIPSMIFEGLTVVISPLISLMLDQVLSLKENGIRAAFLNSTLTSGQQRTVLSRAADGAYQIMYVAPERLSAPSFITFCQNYEIPFIAVDEAHCISQWGHAFRPDYLQIRPFIESLPTRPVVGAYTATATAKVREDIVQSLGLRDPLIHINSFDRPNLSFEVRTGSKQSELLDFLGKHPNDSGIIYCGTRSEVERISDKLIREGMSATRYHAGLSDEERTRNQNDFLYDRCRIMAATNAFGMGIDKSNVGFVVHYNMPKNIESYYQEAGRAGRDGSPAECLLLYSPQDVKLNEFLITKSLEETEELSNEERERRLAHEMDLLKQMTFYATSNECLRLQILRYFGEAASPCGNCGNCRKSYEIVDISSKARIILCAVRELEERNRFFGRITLRDFFKGARSKAILDKGLEQRYGYGMLSHVPAERILQILDCLIQKDLLRQTEGQYPILRLGKVDPAYWTSEDQEMIVNLPKPREKISVAAVGKKKTGQTVPGGNKEGLFDVLRSLRKEIADERGVPAFIIFSNATLIDMARIRPTNMREFLMVKGVGKAKAQEYGQRFLECIRRHEEENVF